MAWSGLGSGTIGDPYQVTSEQEMAEMSTSTYSSSDYFLLMNDITLGTSYDASISMPSFYANFNGGNNTITSPGYDLGSASPCIYIYRDNISIQNANFVFPRSAYTYTIQPIGTYYNITISSCGFKTLPYYMLDVEETPAQYNFMYGTCASSWVLSDLNIEGPYSRIFQTVQGSIDNISVILTKPVIRSGGIFCNQFSGVNTHIKNVSVKFPYAELKQGGVLLTSTTGTNNIIENCYFTGSLAGHDSGVIAYQTSTTTLVKNCYFNGDLLDYNEYFNTNGINFIRDFDSSLVNCYAYVHSFKKAAYHEYDTSSYFNDLGYTDWYIPSKDELDLCRTKASVPINSYKHMGASQTGWITSSESTAYLMWVYDYNGWQQKEKIPSTQYYAVFPVRSFSYADEKDTPTATKPYLGGYCIYVDTSTKTGIMCSTGWVCNGAKLFDFGSQGSLIGTGTTVGSGQANTALMTAARTSDQSATLWNGGYVYRSKPAYEFYLLSQAKTANHVGNYCAILSKESTQTITSTSGQEYVSDASLRTTATFVDWDFTNTWQQSISGALPTLKDPSINQDKFVGIYSIVKDASKNLNIILNKSADTSIFPDSSVGLKVQIYGEDEVYDSSGFIHYVTLQDTSDLRVLIKPYYIEGSDKIVPYYRDYYRYIYDDLANKYMEWWYPVVSSTIKLNVATVGQDIKLIHGSTLVGNYIFASSRNNGAIVRINKDDYNDVSIAIPFSPTRALDQILYCNGYIWGYQGGFLARLDPSTMEVKTTSLITNPHQGSEPLVCSHDRYIYQPGWRYVIKYDSNYFLGNEISTNCPDGSISLAAIATYDSYSQGQYLEYESEYPEYTGDAKGAVHSGITDGNYLYLAYTTPNLSSFVSISGYIPSIGITCNELHKVDINTMTAENWCVIPQCTDDVGQDNEYVYLGCEVQNTANPSVYGYGCSVLAVKKSDMRVYMLPNTEGPMDSPPKYQSYGVFKRGNTLIDLRTSSRIVIIDTTEPSTWETGLYNQYVQDYIIPGYSQTNELVPDYDGYMHAFSWNVFSLVPYPTDVYKCFYPSRVSFKGAPLINTLDASIST